MPSMRRRWKGTKLMTKQNDISNDRMFALIDEWIHKERDRAIMKRRFCDGIIYAQIAEEFDMSERQIKRICYENFEKLINHM